MGEVIQLFDQQEGTPFEIQDSLPFDGRTVSANPTGAGVVLTEDLDGEQQTVYISIAELNALLYIMSNRQ